LPKKVYIIELDARNEAALKKIDQVEGRVLKSSGRMEKAMNRIGVALVAAFSAQQVLSFMRSSIDAFKESEVAIKKLDTALGKNSRSLQNYAKDLQKITTFSDDATIEAMSLIAAFTKEEDKIKGLIRVTQDFATAKGVDLSSAADLVTKTFASSTNALARYGIKVEGAAGSTERYNSLLKALTIYMGQAEAQGKTLTGQMERLNNEINDQQEEIGEKLAPVWLGFFTALNFSMKSLVDSGKLLRQYFETGMWMPLPGEEPEKPEAMKTYTSLVAATVPWLKQQQDRLQEIKETIEGGNLTEAQYIDLKKEEAKIQDSLTLKKEKEIELLKEQYDIMSDIYERMRDMDEEMEILPDYQSAEDWLNKKLTQAPTGRKSTREKRWEELDKEIENAVSPMNALVSLSNQMASNFSFAGHTFVGQLSQAIAMVDSISNMILVIASMFGGGGGFGIGGLLSLIGLEKGGRITNLGGNISHTKIPSFAMGGSYTTPAYGGGYPVMVHKNETLDVYNAGQTSRMENKLDQIRNAILTTNLHVSRKSKGGGGVVQVSLDGKVIAAVIQKEINNMTRSGKNVGDFR